MSGLATSGTLTHWFRDNFAPELDPQGGDDRARRGSGSFAARRERADPPSLFLRRAHADPRSARQGRALRAEPHAHSRRHLSRVARRASPTARTTSSRPIATPAHGRDASSRSAAARRTRSGRRRPPTSSGFTQIDLRAHHRRVLRRCVPGGARRRRREARGYPRLEPGRLGDRAESVGGLSAAVSASIAASTSGRRISCARSRDERDQSASRRRIVGHDRNPRERLQPLLGERLSDRHRRAARRRSREARSSSRICPGISCRPSFLPR